MNEDDAFVESNFKVPSDWYKILIDEYKKLNNGIVTDTPTLRIRNLVNLTTIDGTTNNYICAECTPPKYAKKGEPRSRGDLDDVTVKFRSVVSCTKMLIQTHPYGKTCHFQNDNYDENP